MIKVLTLIGPAFIFLVGMFTVACSSPQPSATPLATSIPEPTAVPVSPEPPTLTPIPSPSPNIEATVEARLAATLEAIPSPTPVPTVTPIPTEPPTSTPIPTLEPTVTPTPTAKPTLTPMPTPTPGQTSTPAPSPTPTLTLTPTPSPTPTLVPTPTSIPGAWHDWVAEDRLTGEKAALFSTEATYHNLEWPYDAPSLVVRCVGKNSAEEVFIVWDKYMSSGVEDTFIGQARFDLGSPSTVVWSESTSNEATFADHPGRLLDLIKSANTAFFRIQDFSGEDHDAEFNVTGLSDAMAKYPDLCRG